MVARHSEVPSRNSQIDTPRRELLKVFVPQGAVTPHKVELTACLEHFGWHKPEQFEGPDKPLKLSLRRLAFSRYSVTTSRIRLPFGNRCTLHLLRPTPTGFDRCR